MGIAAPRNPSDYLATSDRDTFKKLKGSFDLILSTVSANLNLQDYRGS